MPVAVPTSGKNIWIAAGDGDLERVQELIEHGGVSPNVPDENTYTPMHAAASYGQIHILQYLLDQGGNVNILDEDGDTPLYTVENFETAKFLIDHGATWDMKNLEGLSPAECLYEDFPDIAVYLDAMATGSAAAQSSRQAAAGQPGPSGPSEHLTERTAHHLTDGLMYRINEVIEQSEAAGKDPEEDIRAVVSDVFREGMTIGRTWGEEGRAATNSDPVEQDDNKRQRQDET